MNLKSPIPLTHGEATENKETAIVRAATRIVVVKITEEGFEVLFIEHPAKGIELPGGAIDPAEHPEKAALRELVEETGVYFNPEKSIDLSEIVTVVDNRGGSWIDLIYVCIVGNNEILRNKNAEFNELWLNQEEAAKILTSKTFEFINNKIKNYG